MSDAPLLTTPEGVSRVQEALAEHDLDGWLLYEFRGQNWISAALLGTDWTTRRALVLIPRSGEPRALIHAIEHSSWRHWPWPTESYAGWRELESGIAALVQGHPKLALEYSAGDAVPTVDLVPAGVVEMVRAAGVEPHTSGDLVSRFFSGWNPDQLEEHRRSGEVVAHVGQESFQEAARALRAGSPHTEGSLTRWILDHLAESGVAVDADTHVAIGPRAADPHYAPEGEGETIAAGDVLLVDLWGRSSETSVFADQTWMGVMSPEAPPRVLELWTIVRDARDAAVDFLERRFAAGEPVRGFEVDDVARDLIERAGYGDRFIHRLGHSMDQKLHGSGPNLDNLESRDDRLLVPGVGFSIEPGIYLPDDVGMRSEINVFFGPDGPEVSPVEPQVDLILLEV